MNTTKQRILLVLLSCAGNLLPAFAQPSLQTSVDKTQILIGNQLKVKVQASFQPEAYFVRWMTVPDSLPHFELVEKSKIDSVYADGKLTALSQTFTLTSFDSGQWPLPSFNVKFTPSKGDSTLNFFSDSLPVKVIFQKDTTTALRDIKAIRGVEKESMLWYWVGGIALFLLLLVLTWLYIRKKKTNPSAGDRSLIPPYKYAMRELKKLDELDLTDIAAVKKYHSALAEILKNYLSGKSNVDQGSKTTGEILIVLKNIDLANGQLSKTATALHSGDAVKFARFIPASSDSRMSLEAIRDTIEIIERSNHIQSKS